MSGWLTIAFPAFTFPLKIFTTPFGNLASQNNSANFNTDKGVCSAGYKKILIKFIY